MLEKKPRLPSKLKVSLPNIRHPEIHTARSADEQFDSLAASSVTTEEQCYNMLTQKAKSLTLDWALTKRPIHRGSLSYRYMV